MEWSLHQQTWCAQKALYREETWSGAVAVVSGHLSLTTHLATLLPTPSRPSTSTHLHHACVSDVHVTSDGVIIMFHDPSLERTTDGTGTIKTQPWNGVIEHVRTTKQPSQQLPTFHNVCELLMREENRHVKLNVSSDPFGDSTSLCAYALPADALI